MPVVHAVQAEGVNPIQGSYYTNTTTVSSSLHTDVVVEKIA